SDCAAVEAKLLRYHRNADALRTVCSHSVDFLASVSDVQVRLLGSAAASISGSSGSPTGSTATPDP
ncbi:hypothetical protein, partial [Propioniciclava flava]